MPVKRDPAGQWSIIEEDSDAAAIGEAHKVRLAGIDGARSLPGGQDRVDDAMLRQQVQAFHVYSSFREPHAVCIVSIAMAKVLQTPQNLRVFIAAVCHG